MKNTKVAVYKWEHKAQLDHPIDGQYDIDWPLIRNAIGDELDWLLKHDQKDLQLMLEVNAGERHLVADFYNKRTLVEYHLMWAK
jgi:hypothetical protein|tara:strand:- start:2534 stop:2785 length:252 start_codon:yes stop_codon:yes gene_type:complete